MVGCAEFVPQILERVTHELAVIDLLQNMMLFPEAIDRRPERPGKRTVFGRREDQESVVERPACCAAPNPKLQLQTPPVALRTLELGSLARNEVGAVAVNLPSGCQGAEFSAGIGTVEQRLKEIIRSEVGIPTGRLPPCRTGPSECGDHSELSGAILPFAMARVGIAQNAAPPRAG